MIFSTLKNLGISYLVVKYEVTLPYISDLKEYRYQLIAEYDSRLLRLGFHPEREIYRYRGLYMYRNLSQREISIFKNYGYAPSVISDDGVIWELGGRIKRRTHPLTGIYVRGINKSNNQKTGI